MTTVVDDHLEQITRTIWDTLFDFSLESGHAPTLGVDYKLQVVGTAPMACAVFTSQGYPLVVTLLHRSADGST